MARHNEWGLFGEFVGVLYLEKIGYEIRERNWRFSRDEIDCVATKDGVLHFIEIKTRRSLRFGFPEQAVGKKKRISLFRAATAYQQQHPGWEKICFDILAISVAGLRAEFFLINDV